MSFLTVIFGGIVVYCAKNFIFDNTNKQSDSSTTSNNVTPITINKSESLSSNSNNSNYNDHNNVKKQKLLDLIKADKKRFNDPVDYYRVLNVDPNSKPSEIKSAYDDCIQFYQNPIITELCKNELWINTTTFVEYLDNAYAILGDETKKYYYDNSDTIENINDPDDMINSFVDGFVNDFEPNDKSSYWDTK